MDTAQAAQQSPASKAAIVLGLASFFCCWIPVLGLALPIAGLIVSISTRKRASAGTAAIILSGVSLLGGLGATVGAAVRWAGEKRAPAAPAPRPQLAAEPVVSPEPSPTPDEPLPTVSAAKLLADYHSNEVAADAAYKGRRIQLAGVLDNVTKDAFDSVHVNVGTGNPYEILHVVCDVAGAEVAKAAQLRRGDRVLMRGRVAGMVLGYVGVEGAEIISAKR